jgi:general secretion pathway protein I
MIALAVVAVALAALSQSAARFVWNQTGIEQRVIANWVAQNEVVALQSGLQKRLRPAATVKMMGHEWQLKTTTEPTPIPGIVKLTIAVMAEGEEEPAGELVTVWGQTP